MEYSRNKSKSQGWRNGGFMSTQSIPWILLILILTMLGTVLSWNAQVRYQEFTTYQQRLMESSVNGTVAQLELFISELQRSVHLFADTEHKRLEMLEADPDDQKILGQLDAATRKYFPEAFAITVANGDGEPLLTDYNGLIGDVCLKDMNTFGTNRQHSKVYVHPHPTRYHFDIMVDWEDDGHASGIFFVSFNANLLSKMLEHGELPSHKLLLLKQDVPGLIEITADGARIELHREFKLSKEEMSRIGYSEHVKGTLWDVVDLPNANLYSDMYTAIWRETGLIILVFLIVTGMMVSIYQRSQRKRREIEYEYNHDPVTGLPNRHLFMKTLERMTRNGRGSSIPFTLLMIDLGRFQRLKGTFFAHRVDDTLIQSVAKRIEKALEEAKIVARIGEGDYVALLPTGDADQIESFVHKVLTALKQPLGIQSDIMLINSCTGYARFPEDGKDGYALIRHAGTQIYSVRVTK